MDKLPSSGRPNSPRYAGAEKPDGKAAQASKVHLQIPRKQGDQEVKSSGVEDRKITLSGDIENVSTVPVAQPEFPETSAGFDFYVDERNISQFTHSATAYDLSRVDIPLSKADRESAESDGSCVAAGANGYVQKVNVSGVGDVVIKRPYFKAIDTDMGSQLMVYVGGQQIVREGYIYHSLGEKNQKRGQNQLLG